MINDLSSNLISDVFLQKSHNFVVMLARCQEQITASCVGGVFEITFVSMVLLVIGSRLAFSPIAKAFLLMMS
jgi:hypothetical protein